jgi:hypothetical protein
MIDILTIMVVLSSTPRTPSCSNPRNISMPMSVSDLAREATVITAARACTSTARKLSTAGPRAPSPPSSAAMKLRGQSRSLGADGGARITVIADKSLMYPVPHDRRELRRIRQVSLLSSSVAGRQLPGVEARHVCRRALSRL